MKVVIVWINEGSENLNALAWNGGAGPLRVYEQDNYDTRIALGKSDKLPMFTLPYDALVWMQANPGEPTQISLNCAKAFGFSKKELGE